MMLFREEPVTPVYRRWMCEQVGFGANRISTRLRSRRDCSKASVPASALPRHLAVPFCRSKFTDWLAGAVPNSYPNVDLLWDSVIAGPWGWPRSTVQARVPARR